MGEQYESAPKLLLIVQHSVIVKWWCSADAIGNVLLRVRLINVGSAGSEVGHELTVFVQHGTSLTVIWFQNRYTARNLISVMFGWRFCGF